MIAFFKRSYPITGLFSLIVILLNCSSEKKENAVDNSIILKINNFELTRYEFEKSKSRTLDAGSGQIYKSWLENYIDNAYILADAYHKKYDTLTEINRQLGAAEITMISMMNGYLWKHEAEPRLQFTDEEIEALYIQRNKIYYFEYLRFPDKNTYDSLTQGNSRLISEAYFKELKRLSQPNKAIICKKGAYLKPFNELVPFEDKLDLLKEGEISVPLYDNRFLYIVYLRKTETTKQKPFDIEKEQLECILRNLKSKRMIETKQKEIFDQARIAYNKPAIHNLWLDINSHETKRLASVCTLTDTLLSYTFDMKELHLTVRDFLNHYTHNPLGVIITDHDMLTYQLGNYVLNQYLYAEAEELGITKDPGFLLDKRFFQNNLIRREYEEKEIHETIFTNEEEMYKYYQHHKTEFMHDSMCIVSVFSFNSKESASKRSGKIEAFIKDNGIPEQADSSHFNGLISYEHELTIHPGNKLYPKEIQAHIFDAPDRALSAPLPCNNKTIMYIKSRTFLPREKTFEEVKYEILDIINQEKAGTLKKERVKEIKEKYPLIVLDV